MSAHAQLTFTKLWPNKLRYLSGEEATFEVRLKNTGSQAWQGQVTGVIESELSRRTPVFDRALRLGPGQEQRLDERLKIQLPEFGHALYVVAKAADGAVAAEAREVFCVGPWYYNMGRCTTTFNLRKYRTPEQLEAELVSKWRATYVTTVEHFSGSPGVWGGLVPAGEEWYTGQGGYPESMTSERALVEACHRNGLAVTFYTQFGSYGPAGEEHSRAHPEMLVYNERGRPGGWFNMAEMDCWRTMTPQNHKFGTPGALVPNVADPKVQAFGVEEIIRCAKLFNYDGCRWDGHVFGEGRDIFGKKIEGDLDALNAQWVRYMELRTQEAIPGFTVNYNNHPQGMNEGRDLPKTYREMGPNAYILSPFVHVDDPENRLWWKPVAQERTLGRGRRLLVTHLLNRPVHERQDPFEKDAPPVQRNVRVTLTLKPGERLAAVFILNPDADRLAWCAEAQVSKEGDRVSLTVPSVEFWSFVPWELQG